MAHLKRWARLMKRYLLIVALFTSGCVSAPDDVAAVKQRVDALEKDVALLKAENKKLKGGFAEQQREYAQQVYTMNVVPLVKPMLKDFGMDESLLVPVDKVENLADAYRPLLLMIQKLGAVADVAAAK
jgi:hypothetical protein